MKKGRRAAGESAAITLERIGAVPRVWRTLGHDPGSIPVAAGLTRRSVGVMVEACLYRDSASRASHLVA
jgi:hypothetical protein